MSDGAITDPSLNRTEHIDENISAKRVGGYAYDAVTGQWTRSEAGIKYSYFQFDPDDSAPNYIGKNTNSAALDGDSTWVIYKFTYSGSNVTKIVKKTGTWSGRVALFP